MNVSVVVVEMCKVLGEAYNFSMDFVPAVLKQLWIQRDVSTHKSHLQSVF